MSSPLLASAYPLDLATDGMYCTLLMRPAENQANLLKVIRCSLLPDPNEQSEANMSWQLEHGGVRTPLRHTRSLSIMLDTARVIPYTSSRLAVEHDVVALGVLTLEHADRTYSSVSGGLDSTDERLDSADSRLPCFLEGRVWTGRQTVGQGDGVQRSPFLRVLLGEHDGRSVVLQHEGRWQHRGERVQRVFLVADRLEDLAKLNIRDGGTKLLR